MSVTQLADILKRRNVRKVRYFHTDHFEPWSKGVNANTAKGVELFAKQSKQSRFAEKLSLFYHTFLPFRLDQTLVAKNQAGVDAVVLGNRSDEQHRLAREAMLPVERDGKHEIHIHIHHESWTRNTEEYSKDISRWVNQNSSSEMDSARLEKGIRLTKEYIAHDIGRPIERWGFVHGNWALNGSDRSICWIENEIELLMKHGCFGDFTFPAGRGYCDPAHILEPYTCIPVTKPKGYDLPEAKPITIQRGQSAFGDGRFFIWNSPIKADYSSLDYYSEPNRERFKDTLQFVKIWLEKSVVIDGVLHVKTHAHSMKWEYEIEKGENPIPHLYPDIREIFNLFEKTCDAAAVEIEVVTVNQLMESLEQTTRQEPPPPAISPIEGAIDALGKAMTAWLDGSAERDHAAGDFYKVRIKSQRWLEDYELATVRHVLNHYDPANTVLTEIGCGLGTLTSVLAALGYRVKAVEGDRRRSEGAKWIKNHMKAAYPQITNHYTVVEGFYPDVLTAGYIEEGKVNILISTNLIHSFSAKNQERIIKSALLFDRFILDSSRFGVTRNEASSVSSVENSLTRHFNKSASVFSNGVTSLTEFVPLDATKPRNDAPEQALAHVAEVLSLSIEVGKDWLQALHAQGAKDNFMEDKINRQPIDRRETVICEQLCRLFDPTKTRIIEVGSACGALALLLAVQGFEVIGFEGNVRRAKAAEQLNAQWIKARPDHPISLSFIAQLFPKGYDHKLLQTEKRTVLLATNIVGTYSAENQCRLLGAAANFNDVVIDLGRFGVNRDTQEQRTALLHSICSTHFHISAPLLLSPPYEFWHFTVPEIITQQA